MGFLCKHNECKEIKISKTEIEKLCKYDVAVHTNANVAINKICPQGEAKFFLGCTYEPFLF